MPPQENSLQLGGNHCGKSTRVRVKLVQPRSPEADHGWIRDSNTAEGGKDKTKERVKKYSNLEDTTRW